MFHYSQQLVAYFVSLLSGAGQVVQSGFLETLIENICQLLLETRFIRVVRVNKKQKLWALKTKTMNLKMLNHSVQLSEKWGDNPHAFIIRASTFTLYKVV